MRPPVRRRRARLVVHEDAASLRDADLSDDASGRAVPMIPVIDEGVDVCGAALAYAAAGLYVLPIDAQTKNPGSVLRRGWHLKSSRDPQQIVSWFAATNHGLALHLGPSGLMAFDVDNPEQLPAVLAELFAASDPPFQSTRTGQPGRGHFLFRVPPERSIGNSLGGLPTGWGDVRGCNGIIVVAPTGHSKAEQGGCYRWQSTGIIPVLPSTIADLLPDAMNTDEAATDAEVQDFLVTHTEGSDPGRLRPIVERYQRLVGTGASRHHTLVSCLIWGCKEVLAGNISSTDDDHAAGCPPGCARGPAPPQRCSAASGRFQRRTALGAGSGAHRPAERHDLSEPCRDGASPSCAASAKIAADFWRCGDR